ncbi:hypothetical protein AB0M44_47745 [Streptosporangium subroseum]
MVAGSMCGGVALESASALGTASERYGYGPGRRRPGPVTTVL